MGGRFFHALWFQMPAILIVALQGPPASSFAAERESRDNERIEQAVMDKIFEIVSVGMVGVQIMLIGRWIWITGNARRYAEQLGKNGLKMRWHRKRLAWYWHLPSKRKYRFNSNVDLDDLGAAQSLKFPLLNNP